MKILYVDTEQVWRGGQEQLFTLMLGMKERGYSVCLAAPARSLLLRRASESQVRTFSFLQRSEWSPMALYRLHRIFRQERFDVVHFNTPVAVLLGGIVSWWKKTPVRVCSRRVNFPLRNRLSPIKYNQVLDGIITVSESIRGTLIAGGVWPELVSVVYEGVDVGWVDRLSPSAPVPNVNGLLVGTVAHLSEEKGHSTLLEAVSQLDPRFSDVTFLFIGEGELRDHLERQVRLMSLEDRVRFTGFRADPEAIMKTLDIFCLPSLSEGLSSAILAAMACRLPVVATRVGGIPELVADGVTGFLVPSRNPDELRQALSQLLSSVQLRRRMGHAGRVRIESSFTLKRKLDETETLYLKLLKSPHLQ